MTPSDSTASEGKPYKGKWVTGDPIPDVDRESIRNLIYAGFSRRKTAQMLGLHKDMVGEVFDEYAPHKHANLSPELEDEIRDMIKNGSSLHDIAISCGVSQTSARAYVRSLGVHPRTLTEKYLRERKQLGDQ